MILERRSQAGKVLYRSVSGGWNGSEEDKYRLQEQLELLQKDPTYLSSDATLPELNNEMAPVSVGRHTHLHLVSCVHTCTVVVSPLNVLLNLSFKHDCKFECEHFLTDHFSLFLWFPFRCLLLDGWMLLIITSFKYMMTFFTQIGKTKLIDGICSKKQKMPFADNLKWIRSWIMCTSRVPVGGLHSFYHSFDAPSLNGWCDLLSIFSYMFFT